MHEIIERGTTERLRGHEDILATPLDTFVLKVRSDCNLHCPGCYVYEKPDRSFETQPDAMSLEVVTASIARIAEHVTAHDMSGVTVVLHGGEPLLYGIKNLEQLLGNLKKALPQKNFDLRVRMTTNGLLLSRPMLKMLASEGVKVGVSLDGDQQTNDRTRIFKNGRGSYRAVSRVLGRLEAEEYASVYRGILCTIDVGSDPITVYDDLLSFNPPWINFLPAHATWDDEPTGWSDWLIPIFDKWYSGLCDRPDNITDVGIFHEALDLVARKPHQGDTLGLDPVTVAVIETNGNLEQSDHLKACYDGAASTGMNVFDNTLDEMLQYPSVRIRQVGRAGLSQACLDCPIVNACGGGNRAHQFSGRDRRVTIQQFGPHMPAEGVEKHVLLKQGFDNPSAYCEDLQKFFWHVRAQMVRKLPTQPIRPRSGVAFE